MFDDESGPDDPRRAVELSRMRARDADAWLLQRRDALPAALRKKVPLLTKEVLTPRGKHDDRPERIERVMTAYRVGYELERLTDAERAALFAKIFPKLADAMEGAWQIQSRRAVYSRRMGYWGDLSPFRAGSITRLTTITRGVWFHQVTDTLRGLDPDPVWLASWLSYLYDLDGHVASILSAALDTRTPQSKEVLETLKACATNTHPIGFACGGIFLALLGSERREAWGFVQKLLLTAQRQEGLRQSICERLDEGHPEAFIFFLRTILEEDLVRFSSVVRAADVWFGLAWDSASPGVVRTQIERVLEYLTDAAARLHALATGDGEETYMALWATAFKDLGAAVREGERLVREPDPERRFAVAYWAAMAELEESLPAMTTLLTDKDERVVAGAVNAIGELNIGNLGVDKAGLLPDEKAARNRMEPAFDALLPLFDAPGRRKGTRLKPIIWPWTARSFSSQDIGAAILNVTPSDRTEELASRIAGFSANGREQIAMRLGLLRLSDAYGDDFFTRRKNEKEPRARLSEVSRGALIGLLGDASSGVRNISCRVLGLYPLEDDEAATIEGLLTRKASDLRTWSLARLLSQPDASVIATAARLLDTTHAEQQRAGAELLATLITGARSVEGARRAAAERLTANKPLDARAKQMLAGLGTNASAPRTFENCLGLVPPDRALIDPKSLPKPRECPPMEVTIEAFELIASLNAWVKKHRELPVDHSERDLVLGEAGYWQVWDKCPQEVASSKRREDGKRDLGTMQHADLWMEWWNQEKQRHGAEARRHLLLSQLALALAASEPKTLSAWPKGFAHYVKKSGAKVDYIAVKAVLDWIMVQEIDEAMVESHLDQAERSIAAGRLACMRKDEQGRWVGSLRQFPTPAIETSFAWWMGGFASYCGLLSPEAERRVRLRRFRLFQIADAHWPAYFRNVLAPKYAEEIEDLRKKRSLYWYTPVPTLTRPSQEDLIAALEAGLADEHDVVRLALHAHEGEALEVRLIRDYKGPRALREHVRYPALVKGILAIRDAVAESELLRGDVASDISMVATRIDWFGGVDVAVRALAALDKGRLERGGFYGSDRTTSLSRMLVHTVPEEADTPERFAALAKQHAISEDRLVECAIYAPHWAWHVEQTLGWPGLEEAAWWLRAHTKNAQSVVARSFLEDQWRASIAARSPIDPQDFEDGAIDSQWFARIYDALGPERWERVYALAKAAARGANHKRAQLFADALLGKVSAAELTQKIVEKRHQDSIRALGLVPLPGSGIGGGGAGRAASGPKARQELKQRYLTMQEIRRTSRKHGGSMLQASEKRAVEIGMDNLARTAGYADPQRLQWAMEIEALGELARGPVSREAGEITVTLSVDDSGTPDLVCVKKGKRLATIPAATKKLPAIAELVEQSRELKKQKARVRQSLEGAMCRAEPFTGRELADLCAHPVLRPMLERLVLIASDPSGSQPGSHASPPIGYPTGHGSKRGIHLRSDEGREQPIEQDATYRVAHPTDLLATGRWSSWQRECFRAERVQPFKQVFRELYVPTPRESGKESRSTRYAGHQVHPRQALALLGARGWVTRPDEGVQRAFHAARILATLEFAETFYTPADVEGLTLQSVNFTTTRGEPIPIEKVPDRIFSETMRDVDLVVSVAHRGGVDPEASESSIESRAALVRETAALLRMENVRVEQNRAFIEGELGSYSVHLGSGTIHKLPGGAIWVVAVGAHHRGRLFLPFADEDPKSAEVLSKVIMLARDRDILDPSIAQQIRS